MSLVTFPIYYGGERRTREQLLAADTVKYLEPEYRRRVLAMMDAAKYYGVDLGIGTGWRIQPYVVLPDGSITNKPGFALPGNSYHESMPSPPAERTASALAVDMVPTGSWPWMNANCIHFGLIHFANVNNEPWHVQPVEIPRSRSGRTEPYHLAPFRPSERKYSGWPMFPKAPLRSGSLTRKANYGDDVRYAKGVMKNEIARFARFFAANESNSTKKRKYLLAARRCENLTVTNPKYTWHMKRAVRAVQDAFGLTADGYIGTGETWPFIDRLADGVW